MSAEDFIEAFVEALQAILDLDEDGLIEAWDRTAVFELEEAEVQAFADTDCADDPPDCYLLMVRHGETTWYEMVWEHDDDADLDECPVVAVSPDGETQVLAPDPITYLDTILATNGQLGGAAEEDLIAARDEASEIAQGLAETMRDELDHEPPSTFQLGEKWDKAQEAWDEMWSERVDGLVE